MLKFVSVPSRGISFLNSENPNLTLAGVKVSVPSRGISFLNYIICVSFQASEGLVSVPSRGISFLNLEELKQTYKKLLCFRPLSGNLFPKRIVAS